MKIESVKLGYKVNTSKLSFDGSLTPLKTEASEIPPEIMELDTHNSEAFNNLLAQLSSINSMAIKKAKENPNPDGTITYLERVVINITPLKEDGEPDYVQKINPH